MNVILTLISIISTAFLTLALLALYIKRTLPTILENVAIGAGESISEQLNETLASPNVKRAMSVLGKQSGEARADNALRNKAADAIVDFSPAIGMALEKIGLTPLEGIKLYNDPVIGPIIQGLIGSFGKSIGSKGAGRANPSYGGKM